jgi:Zn finger protein HypA/HybF involved in hydrogenase expression
MNDSNTLEVICLKCDHVYLEETTPVKVCPNCGNDDMMKTIYSVDEP